MKLLLAIAHSKTAAQAVPWLIDSAADQNAEIYITTCLLNPLAVPGRVSAWPLIEDPKKVRAALDDILEQYAQNHVKLLDDITSDDPDREIANLINKLGIDV